MTNTLKINHINHTIVMDRTFARNATDTRSEECTHLQQVRRDYPGYQVVQRRIRTNSNKKTYKGLTYEYMEDYILTHGTDENRKANYKEYTEKRIIAECHGKAFRYPVIKSWFLESTLKSQALVWKRSHKLQSATIRPQRRLRRHPPTSRTTRPATTPSSCWRPLRASTRQPNNYKGG